MTLTANEIIVSNLALGLLGEQKITSGMTSSVVQYEACERYYDDAVREVLSEHIWNEAKKRTILVQSATGPVFGYDYKFAIPSDFVRVVRLGDGDNDWDHWEIEDGYILTSIVQAPIAWSAGIEFIAGQYCTLSDVTYLCNTSHTSATATSPATDTSTWTTAGGDYAILEMEYVYELTDISKWSPKLKDAIAQKLAIKVAPVITQNPKARFDLVNEYESLTLRKARSIDAQQGRIRPIFKSRWWDSRK